MNDELAGAVCVVTGGSRGIGRAIVLEAVARGARVAFCARALGPESEAVEKEAVRIGGPDCVLSVACDVSKEAEVEGLFDATLARFDRVDVVVINAGKNRDDLLVNMDADAFDDVIATNLTGAFLVARRAVQEFLAQGDGGRLVAIGSFSQNGATSQTSYAASKGGLVGLMRSIAKEYGHRGITANVIAAGLVDTSFSEGIPPPIREFLLQNIPLRRPGTPAEIAQVALFLGSKRARFINGETVYASGGFVDMPR
jgi:3-oxoacyl-[acyl-carrier protein] reductase